VSRRNKLFRIFHVILERFTVLLAAVLAVVLTAVLSADLTAVLALLLLLVLWSFSAAGKGSFAFALAPTGFEDVERRLVWPEAAFSL
jgi:hypothetical protein